MSTSLIDNLRQAVAEHNAALASEVAESLRFSHGFNNSDIQTFANTHTGISAMDWEALMQESGGDDEACITCGDRNDDGEGWNGECGGCADKSASENITGCSICGGEFNADEIDEHIASSTGTWCPGIDDEDDEYATDEDGESYLGKNIQSETDEFKNSYLKHDPV